MNRIPAKLLILILATWLAGCANVARIEKLPSSSDQIPFSELAKRAVRSDTAWNLQTEFDHYLEVREESADRVHSALENALIRSGYEVVRSDKNLATVQGKRGLRLNEWNAVAGAYYRAGGSITQVYIRAEITQDITGSLNSNRAQEIGDLFCSQSVSCVARR